jgi:hypothetical protein
MLLRYHKIFLVLLANKDLTAFLKLHLVGNSFLSTGGAFQSLMTL